MGTAPSSFDLLPTTAKRRHLEFLMHADVVQRARQKLCIDSPTGENRRSYAEARRFLHEAEHFHSQVRAGRAPDALQRLEAMMLEALSKEGGHEEDQPCFLK